MGENISRRSAVTAMTVLPCVAAGSLLIKPQEAFAADSTDLAAGSTSLTVQASTPSVSYRVHVQNDGWQGYKTDGAVAGTSGRSLRLEGINIKLANAPSGSGITYRTHVQNDGWQGWKKNDEMAGTQGRSLRLEGIEIKLTGAIANDYDVFYRVHVQNIGWQGWVKNGTMAGTQGQSLRLEAIQIKLVKHGTAASISYRAHVQNVGWQSYVAAGKVAGTEGRSLRVEALTMQLNNGSYAGDLQYRAHVQNVGWQGYVSADGIAGTTGRGLRVEALQIKLTGELANAYDIYYRTHVQNYGWLDWAKNGADAGSSGKSLRVEAFEVRLVAKGGSAPGGTEHPTVNSLKTTLKGVDIFSGEGDRGINVAGIDADFVIVKATEGTTYINPYYRSHADAALSSGKKLGFYHFARIGDATAQADYFVNAIGPYVGRAALFLDWENGPYSGILLQGPGWVKTFCDRVYARTGVKPLIYMSQSVTNEYNWSSVAPTYGLWMARYLYRNMYSGYLENPDGGDGYSYWSSLKLYQYSSTGSIGGYSGTVDLDIFYGTEADWDKMAAKS